MIFLGIKCSDLLSIILTLNTTWKRRAGKPVSLSCFIDVGEILSCFSLKSFQESLCFRKANHFGMVDSSFETKVSVLCFLLGYDFLLIDLARGSWSLGGENSQQGGKGPGHLLGPGQDFLAITKEHINNHPG